VPEAEWEAWLWKEAGAELLPGRCWKVVLLGMPVQREDELHSSSAI